MRFLVWGAIPLGALLGGTLSATVGLRTTLFVGAAGGFLGCLPLLLSPLPSLAAPGNATPAALGEPSSP